MTTPINEHPEGREPLHAIQDVAVRSALVQARPVRYDLIVGRKVVGVISLVEEDSGERWLLEIDAFGGQQVSVKFTREQDAHRLAEEWMLAQERVDRVADTMQQAGQDFVTR